MAEGGNISRRQFVTTVISAAAVSSLPVRSALAEVGASGKAVAQTTVALTDSPNWKDQGIENLARSPYAKLKNIPVHAVTIESGFWERRRVINVAKAFPACTTCWKPTGA